MSADPSKLKKFKELSRRDVLFSVARQPQTSRLVFGSSDFKVYDVDLASEKPEPRAMEGHTSYVTGVALVGSTIISGGWDGKLIWWNAETREPIRTVDAHKRWIRGVAASPDGKLLASVADDMVARIWNVEDGAQVHELVGHEVRTPTDYPSMLFVCAFSPDGKHLATADKVGHIVIWDVATGKQLKTLEAPTMYTWDPKQRRHSIGGVRSLAFSPDGKSLAVGGMGQVGNIDHLGGLARVEIFNWQEGQRTHEFPGDKIKGLVEHLHYPQEGNWLLAAGGDHGGFMTFFDLEKKSVIKEEKAPMHVHSLAVSETSDTIYSVGHNKIVVWELKAEEAKPEGETKPEEKKEEA